MDIEQDQNQFVVELEKLLTSEVSQTLWSPNMDLLALSTFDHLVQLYRISYKAQRVFKVQQSHQIISLAFSPDSQTLAYGLVDGTIRILRSENGERIVSLQPNSQQTIERGQMNFLPFCEIDSALFMPFQKGSMQSKLILNISPYKNCNRNALVKINYFSQLGSKFNLLLTSHGSTMQIFLNGFIPFASINFQNLGLNSSKVLYNYFDKKYFHVILQQQNKNKAKLWYVRGNPILFQKQKQQIIKASCLSASLTEIIIFLQSAYTAAQVIVTGALRQYNSKLRLIDDPNIQNINPCQQLFRFLNCGSASTALVTFFTKQVYDTKILEKLDQALNVAFAQLHDLLLQSIQNALERAMIILNRLKNIAETTPKRGISLFQLIKTQQKLIKLYTMGDVLLAQSTQAKFDIRNLLVWLNKATIRSSGQNQAQIENTKSYLNKYTVDFSRLHAFLKKQQNFYLTNLLKFFDKTNKTHLIVLQNPQFRVLSKQVKKQSQSQNQKNKKMSKLFDVQDIENEDLQLMQIQQQYRSFKIQSKQLLIFWKNLTQNCNKNISKQLYNHWQTHNIGQFIINPMFPIQIKASISENKQLMTYFIQKRQQEERLYQFNCQTRQMNYLKCNFYNILSFSVSNYILLVLQEKKSSKKIVGMIQNNQFNGDEIEIGKRISKIDGVLDVNCSSRGLNSIVIDKNKLIIFA